MLVVTWSGTGTETASESWLGMNDTYKAAGDEPVLEAGILHDLGRLGRRRKLLTGEVLVRQGDPSTLVYLVMAGALDASVTVDGAEAVVGRSVAGGLIGEVAALAGLKRSATLRAAAGSTAVEVVEIEPVDLVRWLGAHPEQESRITESARQRLNSVHVAEMVIEVLGVAAADLVPKLLEVADWVDLVAGATLFEQGDQPDAAYFVLSGRLQVSRHGPGEATEVIGVVGRNEVVGEVAIIERSPRTATVTALRDTSLARISVADFEHLLGTRAEFAMLMLRRLVARMHGVRSEARTARSVAVVVVDDIDPADLVTPMMRVLEAVGPTALLSSDRADSLLGRSGGSQSTSTGLLDARLSHLLHEFEAGHQQVIYLADRTPTEWSRRIMQRADTVVVVAAAAPSSETEATIARFLDSSVETGVPRWLVVIDDASTTRPTTATSTAIRARFDEVHHVRRDNPVDIARLARLSVGAGFGLVLGGGGARGFAHLGVIKAMSELGIPIDRIGGASMGSIFAAGAAMYDDMNELLTLSAKQFNRLIDYTVPLVSLLKAKRITANLHSVFGGIDVEDLWIPLYCVSTNLTRSSVEVHRRGDLVTAIRASIAIPGVLPPVPYGDDLLVDGGVLNNVPADVMRADPSIATVIAVDVAPTAGPSTSANYGNYVSGFNALRHFIGRKRSPYPGVASVLMRTMITGSEGRRTAMRTDGTADLYLDIEMQGVGLLEFDKMTPVVERGYVAALPRLQEWLAARGGVSSPPEQGA